MGNATHASVRSQTGTVPYTAPETFTHDHVTKQTDVYAFGIIGETRCPPATCPKPSSTQYP